MQFIDMHCDTLLECYLQDKPLRENDLQIDLQRIKKTGGMMQFFAAFLISGEAAREENVTLTPYELFFKIEELYESRLARIKISLHGKKILGYSENERAEKYHHCLRLKILHFWKAKQKDFNRCMIRVSDL